MPGSVRVLGNGGGAILHGDMPDADLRTMEELVHGYGGYRLTTEGQVLKPGMGIGEGIPVGSPEAQQLSAGGFSRGRVLNNTGTELIFASRIDVSMKADELLSEHGDIYGRAKVPEDDQPLFRGLYTVIDRSGRTKKAEGEAPDALYARVQELQARRFVPAARELFGTPIVVPKMLFANLLLPGQEVSMHHDVPEFRGIHPRSAPNWLQCVMHHSGLFARWRILQCAALTYFQDMSDGGSLAAYVADGEGEVVPTRRGLGLILEAETFPHHSDVFPRQAGGRPVPRWPEGVRLQYEAAARHWVVTAPGKGEIARYPPSEVRISTQMKLHCFRSAAEERAYLDHTDDLDVGTAIGMLADDLRRRGRFSGAPPSRSELGLMMIREYIRWPSPGAVARCWAPHPRSVFAPKAGASRAAAPSRL